MIIKITNYKFLIYNLIKKHYILKYRNTFLGFLWSIVEPITTTILLYIIFSLFAKFNIKYYFLFLFNGLILWQFFSKTLIQGSNILIENSSIIKKIFFPYIILYIPTILINLIEYLISLIILIILTLFFLKIKFEIYNTSLLLLTLFSFLFFLLGFTIFISILNIKYKDISYIITIILKFWFYLTPIIYPYNIIPLQYQKLLYLNPLYPYIIIMQKILYFNSLINIKKLIFLSFFYSFLFLGIGIFLYYKKRKFIPEEV